jgi:hypothetical protein
MSMTATLLKTTKKIFFISNIFLKNLRNQDFPVKLDYKPEVFIGPSLVFKEEVILGYLMLLILS